VSKSEDDDAGGKPLSFLGLKVQRKTDVLAATAFVLALTGTLFQFYGFVRGARVSLYAPEFVTIFFDTYPNGDTVTRIAALMSYVNSGEATYGAIIRREKVEFAIGSSKYEQLWQSFQDIDREGASIVFKNGASAKPVPIPGASAISHSTVFAPRPVTCSTGEGQCSMFLNYIGKSDFIRSFGSHAEIVFDFSAQVLGSRSELRESCIVSLDSGLLALLMMNNWYYAICKSAS
jgi:hypothetical protein